MKGLGFRVKDSRFRVWGLRFLGGARFRGYGSGFRVEGSSGMVDGQRYKVNSRDRVRGIIIGFGLKDLGYTL